MKTSEHGAPILQLALETTGRSGSLALDRGGTILQRVTLETGQRSAAALAPHLERALQSCRDQAEQIDQVTVADGPGSFTGLRIAVTTAKTLAYALNIRLVAVDSLAAIAATVFHDHPNVSDALVALDAYRGQVFWGQFNRSTLLPDDVKSSSWSRYPDCVAVDSMAAFQKVVNGTTDDIAIAGDAKPFGDRADQLRPRSCDAVGVAMMGRIAAQRDDFIDPMTLVPRYLKLSAAEEAAT